MSKRKRRRCLSRNTDSRQPCQNWEDACPYDHHQQKSRRVQAAPAAPALPPIEPRLHDQTEGEIAGRSLSDAPQLFKEAVQEAALSLRINTKRVERDYWMTRCLQRLVVQAGSPALVMVGNPKAPTGQVPVTVAFGGGTSLVSAWGLVSRLSDDLDLMCFIDIGKASKNAVRRPHSIITEMMFDACEVDRQHAPTPKHNEKTRFRQTFIPLPRLSEELLKVETAVEDADGSLHALRAVTSLIGRHDPGLMAEFGELGGFEVPCVVPAYTVANKLDALHRRTVGNDLAGIAQRGRDLIDLDRIARSEHAADTRRRVPELAERASRSFTREIVPRPSDGYGTSRVFTLGTAANDALRDGYRKAVEETWWGDTAPSPFDDAVKLAASLDLP